MQYNNIGIVPDVAIPYSNQLSLQQQEQQEQSHQQQEQEQRVEEEAITSNQQGSKTQENNSEEEEEVQTNLDNQNKSDSFLLQSQEHYTSSSTNPSIQSELQYS